MLRFTAHATRSCFEWQQQLVRHCSAVLTAAATELAWKRLIPFFRGDLPNGIAELSES